MTGNLYLDGLIVFGLSFLVDIVYAKYTVAASVRQPAIAGCWSSLIFLIGGLNVSAYVTNHWLLFPAAAGAFFGTYIGVKSGKSGE